MALTPNYSWPTPDNDDLVKDGAEAIRDLGNAIDNTVDNLPSGALVHIERQTFSAVSSFSFSNDVFTSTFDNYKILLETTASGSNSILYRGRIAGVDTTSANYNHQHFFAFGTSFAAVRTLNDTAIRIGQISAAVGSCVLSVELFSPKENKPMANTVSNHSTADGATLFGGTGSFQSATSFDSLTIFASAGNMTGKADLYGYSK